MTRPFDDDERALGRALHRRVDHVAESPLGLDDVQSRARVVRRRRRVAAGAAVAAAVAVVVPTALVASRNLGATPGPGPATATASNAPDSSSPSPATSSGSTDSPTAEPTGPVETQPFDLSDLPVGDAPRIDWADGQDVHRADGSVVAGVLPESALGFAPMGTGWVVATGDGEGKTFAQLIPESGMSTQVIHELEGGLATSPLGEAVAFAQPDGAVKVIQRQGEETLDMPAVSESGPYDAVAVGSEDCVEGRTTDAGCMVLVNTDGQAWFTSSHGIEDLYDDSIDELTAWSVDRYAGISERHDDLSTCSVVRDTAAAKTQWETCEHRLMDFSPAGSSVLGVGSVGSGLGEGRISLLDAATGAVLVDLMADEKHQVFARQWAWEDDSHVLLVVSEGLEYSVVRLGTDGSLEIAVEARAGDEVDPSYILSS